MTPQPDALDAIAAELGPLRLPRAYCPHEPSVKQEWFLRRDELEVFIGGAAGPGKAVALDTPLPTPAGWTTMGEVSAGDVVLDRSGSPTLVLAVSDVMHGRDVYRVRFSDGAEIVADGAHLWETMTATEREQAARRDPAFRARRRANRPSRATGRRPHVAVLNAEREYDVLDPPLPKTRTTRQIAASLMVGPPGSIRRRNHSIALHQGLDLPARDLPVDPYVFGIWLGDGHTREGQITTADPAVVSEIERAGFEVRKVPSAPYGWRVVGLTALLRAHGILGDKHVPAVYLRASPAQRLALLQGLMDSDGTADLRGDCEFGSTLRPLAEAVAELVLSLGGLATVRAVRTRLAGRDCGPGWRVSASLHQPMFRLPRKADRQRFARPARSRYVVAVEPVASVPVRCIRTAASTYLAGRQMVATHNSWALLMAALQYVDVPGYHAVILRTVLQDHRKPGGLIPVSHEWLGGTDAWWNGSVPGWTFPSGATLSFGYLRAVADLSHWKGPAYAYVGFDELTEFPLDVYLGINRVLRDSPEITPGVHVPLRKRSASNPGGPGHGWVRRRLIDTRTREPSAVTIRATIHDNPKPGWYEEYLPSLAHLSPIDRKRLIDGDWDVSEEGGKFRREAFNVVEEAAPYVESAVKAVRYWDLAGTEPGPSNSDPDYTVGVLLVADRHGMFTILDVTRGRWNDADVEKVVRQTATVDRERIAHVPVNVFVEQDPGQAGKAQLGHYKRNVLAGFPAYSGSTRIRGVNAAKLTRAATVSAAVANGLYRVAVFPPTNTPHGSSGLTDFLDEVAIFPNGDHDDCVDALSGAHNHLTTRVADVTQGRVGTSLPRARIPGVDARGVRGAARR